ncbi:MAG: ABC transporter ATP-binding protein [Bacteroidota bacterium]
MLIAKGIEKYYGSLHVLKGVDMELATGEVMSLVGTSGAGKSTLLQVLGTLDQADKGKVQFEGQDIFGLSQKQQAAFRNKHLGFIFQFHHLLPEFTALENVCMPAFIAGTGKGEAMEKATSLLERLGLGERLEHKPSELSGGEQQRVAVARAIINDPSLVLADEPTGNLDSANSHGLYDLIFELAHSMKVSFLIATHNQELAAKADKSARIKDGIIVST